MPESADDIVKDANPEKHSGRHGKSTAELAEIYPNRRINKPLESIVQNYVLGARFASHIEYIFVHFWLWKQHSGSRIARQSADK